MKELKNHIIYCHCEESVPKVQGDKNTLELDEAISLMAMKSN